MSGRYAIAVDQGTTNTKAVAIDRAGGVVATSSERVELHFPQSGWAESDPDAIWKSVVVALGDCLSQLSAPEIVSLGICNQRESVVIWDRSTGEPLGPVVSWQCARGRSICDALATPQTEALVSERTGLGLEPMFSASKMRWLIDSVPDGPDRAAAGEICVGTVDSWLVWKLTGGRAFVTDHTNASRTLLFNIGELAWDASLLDLFGVPSPALPEIAASSSAHGECRAPDIDPLLLGVVVGSVLGDSHAALVGQGAFHPGRIKASFGTGTSVMAPSEGVSQTPGLSSTVAWSRDDIDHSEVVYAVEGNIYATGAALEWTAELLGFDHDVARLEELATSTPEGRGLAFVPAFAGLGAPHWDSHVTGLMTGITFSTGRAEFARAAFESVAHQVADVIDAMTPALGSSGRPQLHADGGAAHSTLLSQLVADLADVDFLRSHVAETAAVGAAHLSGLTVGFWSAIEELQQLPRSVTIVSPRLSDERRAEARGFWAEALSRCMATPGVGGEST